MKKFIIFLTFLYLFSCNKSPTDPNLNMKLEKILDKILLAEVEMTGFELLRQSISIWNIGADYQNHEAIRQKWHIVGEDEYQNIYIYYCEFNSETEAIQGTAYAATRSNEEPYIWGSLNGSIIVDGSWVAIDNGAIYFVRGNIGIKIFKPVRFDEEDRKAMLKISFKIQNKIELNLSPVIISFEKKLKSKQIDIKDYQSMTNAVVNSQIMSGFSLYSTWDSKWLIDATNLTMGIRKEWKNEQGAIIGIDISRFDSDSFALKAGKTQGRNTYSGVFNLDNLDSLKSIIAEWQKKWGYGFPKNLFSVVGVKGNIAIHVYQFDPTGIDTNFFYSIVEKLSEQISNF